MKKIISFFVVAALACNLSAQTTTPTKKAAEKDMRKDVVDLKAERKERNEKILHAKFKQAGVEQKSIKADRKHLNANKKHLKNKGVKTPITKAKEQTDPIKH